MKRPPLRNLRKTTIVVVAVFLAFFIHRIVDFCLEEVAVREDTSEVEQASAKGVVCTHVINGSPYGMDTTFDANTRLFFYSTAFKSSYAEGDTLYHVWYNGLDTIQKSPCHLNGESCVSFLEARRVQPGEWSVDFLTGRKLLASRQFKVLEPAR